MELDFHKDITDLRNNILEFEEEYSDWDAVARSDYG